VRTGQGDTFNPIVRANTSRKSRRVADDARLYKRIGKEFAEYATQRRSG
jgi:hypothetical protein